MCWRCSVSILAFKYCGDRSPPSSGVRRGSRTVRFANLLLLGRNLLLHDSYARATQFQASDRADDLLFASSRCACCFVVDLSATFRREFGSLLRGNGFSGASKCYANLVEGIVAHARSTVSRVFVVAISKALCLCLPLAKRDTPVHAQVPSSISSPVVLDKYF